MMRAAKSPESFAKRAGDIRRVNLDRFPYHFLFRMVGDCVRFLSCGMTAGIRRRERVVDNRVQTP
jgi:hypothetical protein